MNSANNKNCEPKSHPTPTKLGSQHEIRSQSYPLQSKEQPFDFPNKKPPIRRQNPLLDQNQSKEVVLPSQTNRPSPESKNPTTETMMKTTVRLLVVPEQGQATCAASAASSSHFPFHAYPFFIFPPCLNHQFQLFPPNQSIPLDAKSKP